MTSIAITARPAPAPTTGEKACLRHGPLAHDATGCPRCGASAYRLDDDGDRATLKAFRQTALKSRIATFTALGAVLAVLADNAVLLVTRPGLFSIDLPVIALGAMLGAGFAWAARTPGQHRLDRQLAK